MHGARKAGKRVRYGRRGSRDQRRHPSRPPGQGHRQELQELLGEFQDSVVAAELLRRLATDAAGQGGDGFTYGVLVAEERQRAERARRRARHGLAGSRSS